MKHFVIYLFSLALFAPLASEAGLSAHRFANQPYAEAKAHALLNRFLSIQLPLQQTQDDSNLTRPTDPESLSKPLEALDISTIPDVGSYADLENQFHMIRDTRYLQTSEPSFPRRLTWLYPDDGCYARAEIAAEHLVTNNFVVPKKVFAFGDLSAKTENSPYGSVQWWYHVAVIYRVGNQPYVLDPALDPKAPMTLNAWNSAINGGNDRVTFVVCSKDTFDPDGDCLKPNPISDTFAESEQRGFLSLEWDRLLQLNREPQKELGEFPPWLNN